MIIQKSGCELLELFLKEFAAFLQSYSIRVKMTSTNDHVVDEEGGIASYLQNNISQCDLVFVVVTEDDEGIIQIFYNTPKVILRLFFEFSDQFFQVIFRSYYQVICKSINTFIS